MIVRKKKLCKGKCAEAQYIWADGKCKRCYYSEKENRTTINKVSDKRQVENVEYLKLRLDFLNKNQMCQAKLLWCTHYATQVHHKAGRVGKLFLNILKWLATCGNCHQWIELHPDQSKELGLSENRL